MNIILIISKLAAMIGVGLLTYYLLDKYFYDTSIPAFLDGSTTIFGINPKFHFEKYVLLCFLTVVMPFVALFIIELTLSRFQSVRQGS